MPKPTSAVKSSASTAPMSVVLLTMDNHLSSTAARVSEQLRRHTPQLHFKTHAAASWRDNTQALQNCINDIGSADLVIVTMLLWRITFCP